MAQRSHKKSFRPYHSSRRHPQHNQRQTYHHEADDYKSASKWVKKANTNPMNDKQYYREKVWNYMEENNIALFPRPVYHRIPNFKMADKTAINLLKLSCFVNAKIVKVNPDKPQQSVRCLCLKMGKKLLVPTPQLKSNGLLNEIIIPSHLKQDIKTLQMAATRKGLQQFGHLLSIHDLSKWNNTKIDICIIGSVAVDKTNGYRIGKGEGYADIEIAIMNELGLIDKNTKFIATVHDCQVFESLNKQLFDITDVRLDYIVTPTQVIQIKKETQSDTLPYKIDWNRLDQERLNKMPVLKILKNHNVSKQNKHKSNKISRW